MFIAENLERTKTLEKTFLKCKSHSISLLHKTLQLFLLMFYNKVQTPPSCVKDSAWWCGFITCLIQLYIIKSSISYELHHCTRKKNTLASHYCITWICHNNLALLSLNWLIKLFSIIFIYEEHWKEHLCV
jgi:hypothetical protein